MAQSLWWCNQNLSNIKTYTVARIALFGLLVFMLYSYLLYGDNAAAVSLSYYCNFEKISKIKVKVKE